MTSMVSYMIGAGGDAEEEGDTNFDTEDLTWSRRPDLLFSFEVSEKSGVGYAEVEAERRFCCDRRSEFVGGSDLWEDILRRLCRLEPTTESAYMHMINIPR